VLVSAGGVVVTPPNEVVMVVAGLPFWLRGGQP
jgi:hypothetical protein